MDTSARVPATLSKKERICSLTLIDQLFRGGHSRFMAAFPLRVVYMPTEPDDERFTNAQMLVSVPKRYFKRAVKRNRVKRQVREAYRKNKQLLMHDHKMPDVAMAFIWLDNKLYDSALVEERVCNLLRRIAEKIWTK